MDFYSTILNTEFIDSHTIVIKSSKPASYTYQAGQYCRLSIPHPMPDSRGESRDFSFASHPGEDHLLFISRIPDLHSTFKEAMKNLVAGDTCTLADPKGHFLLPQSPIPMVWIAAGVGIAPFRSFISSGVIPSTTKLFYTNPTDLFPFVNEFSGINLNLNNSKIGGHFTKNTFTTCDKNALYYLCGNTKFILSVQQVLLELGISPKQFRKDVFTGY